MNFYLLLLILGSILVIEGLPYLLFPDRIKKFYQIIEATDNKALRMMGLIISLIGLLLVYFFRSKICQ